MATIDQVLGNAVRPTIILDGETFTPRKLDWGVISELTSWLRGQARTEFVETLKELKAAGLISSDELFAEARRFNKEMIATREYDFGSATMNQVLGFGTTDSTSISSGQIKMISLLLGCPDDRILDLMTRAKEQVTAYVQQLVADSLQDVPVDPKA